MKRKRSRSSNPFNSMQNAGIGMIGLGVLGGVGAGIDSMTPVGAPKMGPSMNTLAGFAPIGAMAIGAGTVLDIVKKTHKKSKY